MSTPAPAEPATAIRFLHTIPIIRIFDVEKAKEFYCGFLGFKVEWQHTFEPGMPIYMCLSRGDLILHLSQHHGDGSPGVHIFVEMTGIEELHQELTAKGHQFMKPGLKDEFYGARSMNVIDPFGNRLCFNEYTQRGPQ